MVKRPSAATRQSEAASGKRTKTAVEATAPKSKCIAVSVKVASLRAAGYQDFETWLQDKGNLYVGRRGRIFIHDGSSKRIFHFPGSKWQNPFAVSKTTSRQMACEKFRSALLDGSLKDGDGQPLREKLSELRDFHLGCWCKPEACHADVLAELANAEP